MMHKKILLLPIMASLALAPLSASAAQDNFSSSHEPLNPAMATYEEMAAYRSDLDSYVRKLEEEIARLRDKQDSAIHKFNEAVYAYNKDDFYHHDTMRPYPHRRNRYQGSWPCGRGPEYCGDWDDDKDHKDSKREKTPAEKHQDRIDSFIDHMIDWGK